MLTLTAVLFFALAQEPVEGLREGERWFPIAPPAFSGGLVEGFAFGRVLDAASGAPLEGASVEAWTESWDAPAMLIDAAATGRDGAFVLRARDGAVQAEKLRVRAGGFRSTTRSLADGEEVLLVRAPAGIEARAVDLEGLPLEGALFTTRQTCAHEPPAVRVHSDAAGRFDLSAFPAFEHGPEGEVEALGFEALRNLGLEEFGAGAPVHLGRRRPLRIAVLDSHGQWAKGTRVLVGTAPEWSAAFTDERGRARFDSTFSEPQMVLQASMEGRLRFLGEVCAWRGALLTLRLDGQGYEELAEGVEGGYEADAGEESAPGDPRVVITEREPLAPWLLLHADGWRVDGEGEHALPPGRCTLYTGADFSGWREEQAELELEPGERRGIEIAPKREPAVLLASEPEWLESVVLEAGGHSRRWRGDFDEMTRPALEPAVLLASGSGRCVRAVLDGSERDVTVDLEALPPCHPAPAPAPEPHRVRFDVPEELRPHLRAHVWEGERRRDLDLGSSATVELDLAMPCELWLAAPGHLSRCIVLPEAPGGPVDARLSARGSAAIRGDVEEVLGPNGRLEARKDGSFHVEEAAPGPLALRARRAGGSWVALELSLAPGEAREITVR